MTDRRAERRIRPGMRHESAARPDWRAARMAADSEGILTIEELRGCGMSTSGVSRRVRSGHLHPVHQGVYAVGHPGMSLRAQFVAATKACGPGAWLSHQAGAAFIGSRQWTGGPIDVSVPGETSRIHSGVRVHRSNVASRDDLMLRSGILVANATWVLFELASQLRPADLRETVRYSLREGLTSLPTLVANMDRVGGRRGAAVMRQVLARCALPLRSELEDVVLQLIVESGFSQPDVNVPLQVAGRTIIPDFRWPDRRLIIEADGAKWHGDALARADDAERQRLLEASGETVLRVTWTQAVLEREATRRRFATAGVPSNGASGEIFPATGTNSPLG